MSLVMLADRRDKYANPLSGDVRAISILTFQGDELNEVFAAESRSKPIVTLLVSTGNDWFIHQVVTEDGWTFRAGLRDSFPEDGLCCPAILFTQFVVPVGTSCLW